MKKTKLLLALCLAGCMANAQIIYKVAGTVGTNGYTGNGGLAASAELHGPEGVTVDASNNLYIADNGNNVIRKVDVHGVITTVAGNGTAGFSGDAGQATAAELSGPTDVATDAAGNLYIADQNNNRIRKVIISTGIINTVAGCYSVGAYGGDGGQATAAFLNLPFGVVVDGSGNIFISDQANFCIRKVKPTGIISLYAGMGSTLSGTGPATNASLDSPAGVDVDASGNLYFTDVGQGYIGGQRVYKITASTGNIATIAGNGTAGFTGNGGQATAAEVSDPQGIALDASGNIYIADEQNWQVRKIIASTGVISAYAGNHTQGYTGDGGAPASAEINVAYGLAVDASGNVYIPDYQNSAVRKTSSVCPANAGPNVTDVQSCCGWPGVQIGTPTVTNMTYSWSPSTGAALSCTNCAQPISSWSTTTSCKIYTVTVSYSLCTTASSTVQVCAQAFHGSFCCRLANQTTGFAPIEQPGVFSVYPNPASNNVILNLYDYAEYISITDMQGRLVFEARDIIDENYVIDISKYNKGIYFIRAKIGDTIEKQKLIVE